MRRNLCLLGVVACLVLLAGGCVSVGAGPDNGPGRVSSGVPTGWPLVHSARRVTSVFGYRVHPNSGARKLHEGVDIAAPMGTPVVSTADGVVSFSGTQRGYGNIVVVDHGGGYATAYAHLNRRSVGVGDGVRVGEKIGTLGQSGNATAPHVHYEVRRNGVKVDPGLK